MTATAPILSVPSVTVEPPFPWLGGKRRLAREINALLPPPSPTVTYVEPFFGAGALFFSRRPQGAEVINDKNREIINFFQVLRDDGENLVRYLQNIPYSRDLFYEWRNPISDGATPLERAARFFYITRSTFAGQSTGRTPSWAFARIDNRARSMSLVVDNELLRVRDRLRHAYIENDDGVRVIERFDGPDTILYCDPPYVAEERSYGGYEHEFSADDHARLLSVLKNAQGYVAISGYPSELYADLLEHDGWEWRDFAVRCKANQSSGRGNWEGMDRVERVWLNPRLVEWNRTHSSRPIAMDLFGDGVE